MFDREAVFIQRKLVGDDGGGIKPMQQWDLL
jgi:hypothetical protein